MNVLDILKPKTEEEIIKSFNGKSFTYILTISTENGFLPGVKHALEHGADIHISYDLPLRLAAYNGYLETVKYLVEHGADIHAKNDQALRIATLKCYLNIIKYLKEEIAKENK